MGKLERWGSGPDHLTVPLIVPPLATDTTWYSLLWPAAFSAPANSNPNEIANTAVLIIPRQLWENRIATLDPEQVTKVIAH